MGKECVDLGGPDASGEALWVHRGQQVLSCWFVWWHPDLVCCESWQGVVYWVVSQKLTFYAMRCSVWGGGGYCSELFAEGGGYFVVIGDLSIAESYWLVWWNVLFLSGHLGDEPEKTSGVVNSEEQKFCIRKPRGPTFLHVTLHFHHQQNVCVKCEFE